MLQTGTLYSIVNNESSIESKEPIPNVYIYFSQNGVRKLTTKTDAQGKFSFDLPLGSYQVTVSQGATSQVYQLAGGAPFELTSGSKQNAFEEWVLAPIYLKPEENPLVVLMNNLVLNARKSATDAKAEADRAEQAVSDTVGTGKIMREGAYGLGRTSIILPGSNLDDYTDPGFYGIANGADATTIENMPKKIISKSSMFVYSSSLTKVRNDCTQIITHFNSTLTAIRTYYAYPDRWTDWHYIYNTQNTTVDSNGFIKQASPIIRLFDDRIETNGQFKEEPVFEKIGVGTYKISNTLGLAKEGWTYEKPRGKDGNPYFRIIVKKTDDGCIISVHDEFEALEEATIVGIDGNERKINNVVKILGEARDIKPHERWIDLRFHEEPEEIEEIEDFEGEQSDQDKFLEEHNAVLL